MKTILHALVVASVATIPPIAYSQEAAADLPRQIAEVMAQGPSGKAHQRFVHAKGIVCTGTFTASSQAASLSRAEHLNGHPTAVTVRFSDGAPDATVADSAPEAAPRGMAIRFAVGRGTDIMTISHNGFIVGNGQDFLELQQALAATDNSKPHPWPIEGFLAAHPRALKFVQDPKPLPVSFAADSFFSNNAFVLVNAEGARQAARYQIVPLAGNEYIDDAAAKGVQPNYLRDELSARLSRGPVQFRLIAQLAAAGDPTSDGSLVWPDDRKKVELGILTITAVVPDSEAAERALAFDPTHLIDGIELSDDPLPLLRSKVYVYSVANRLGKHK